MNRTSLLLLAAAAVFVAGCKDDNKGEDTQKVSYSIGFKLGERIGKEMSDLDVNGFTDGFKDGFKGDATKADMTQEEMEASVKAYQEKRMNAMREEMKQKSEKNLADAKAFFEQNAKKPGVVTLPSGLQYEVMTKGNGPSPKAESVVKAKYHGTLLDGTVFDSTRDRGDTPAEFPLNRVIPGWTEGVQLMNKGAKYKFWVPSTLGYGERGAGGKIGPNEALVFEIELVDFTNPPAAKKK